MLWIIYYCSTILFLLYVFLNVTWRFWIRKLSFLPNETHIPWLGVIPYLIFKDIPAMHKHRLNSMKEYNHLYVTWSLWTPIVRVGCVKYIEELVKCKDPKRKSTALTVLREYIGDGLILSSGVKWRKRRRALTVAFHFSILNSFIEIFERHGMQLVKKLEDISCGHKAVEVQRLLRLATLDVISETTMGVNIDALNSPDCEYSQAVAAVKSKFLKRLFNPLLVRKTIYKYTKDGKEFYKALNTIHNFSTNVINENISARQKSSSGAGVCEDDFGLYHRKNNVLIDFLLDMYDKGEIDVEGIREEIDTFVLAGHDTTSASLSWLLYEIGRHPEIQQKLQDEIDEVSSKDGSVIDKIRMLKYTKCVIKESLRINPAVGALVRELDKDLSVGENIIPAGTVLLVDTFSVHLNPAYWDEPTVFNPERFQSDVKRNPYCFLPFSAGPRNCIGQKFALLELKVFIYLLLCNFNIKSKQTRDEIKVSRGVVTQSQNGLYLIFSRRK